MTEKGLSNSQKFWVNACLHFPTNNLAIVTQYKGDLDEAILREVINYLQKRHPFLRSKVSTTRPRKFIIAHANLAPEIPLDIRKKSEGKEWLELVREAVDIHIDIEQCPPARFHLHISSDQSELIFVIEHMHSDGISASKLVDELFTLYAEYEETGKLPTTVEETVFEPIDAYIEESSEESETSSSMDDSSEVLPYAGKSGKSNRSGIHHIQLSKEETTKLIQYSREKGIYVQTLLTRLCARALEKKIRAEHLYNGTLKIGCLCPINLRNRVPTPIPDDQLGLMITTLKFLLTIPKEISDSEFERSINQHLENELNSKPTLPSVPHEEGELSRKEFFHKIVWEAPFALVSNVGRVQYLRVPKDIEIDNSFALMSFYEIQHYENNLVFVCSTYNRGLNFILLYPHSLMDSEIPIAILQDILCEIKKI